MQPRQIVSSERHREDLSWSLEREEPMALQQRSTALVRHISEAVQEQHVPSQTEILALQPLGLWLTAGSRCSRPNTRHLKSMPKFIQKIVPCWWIPIMCWSPACLMQSRCSRKHSQRRWAFVSTAAMWLTWQRRPGKCWTKPVLRIVLLRYLIRWTSTSLGMSLWRAHRLIPLAWVNDWLQPSRNRSLAVYINWRLWNRKEKSFLRLKFLRMWRRLRILALSLCSDSSTRRQEKLWQTF